MMSPNYSPQRLSLNYSPQRHREFNRHNELRRIPAQKYDWKMAFLIYQCFLCVSVVQIVFPSPLLKTAKASSHNPSKWALLFSHSNRPRCSTHSRTPSTCARRERMDSKVARTGLPSTRTKTGEVCAKTGISGYGSHFATSPAASSDPTSFGQERLLLDPQIQRPAGGRGFRDHFSVRHDFETIERDDRAD